MQFNKVALDLDISRNPTDIFGAVCTAQEQLGFSAQRDSSQCAHDQSHFFIGSYPKLHRLDGPFRPFH